MKKQHIIFLLVFFAFCFGQQVFAQDIKLSKASDLAVDRTITQAEVDQMLPLIEAAINNYAAAASLLDTAENRVTEVSVERFSSLFYSAAEVVQDYMEFVPSELISTENYGLGAFKFLPTEGVQFRIEGAELKSIRPDGTGFYIPEVLIKKRVFSMVSSDGTTKISFDGRVEDYRFEFLIYQEDIADAPIYKINKWKADLPAADYLRFINFSIGLGRTNANAQTSDYWNTGINGNNLSSTWSGSNASYVWEHGIGESELNVKAGLNYSLGASFVTDRGITKASSPSRKIALSVGLQYASYQLKTQLNNFKIAPFEVTAEEDANLQPHLRLVGAVNGTEMLRMNRLDVSLGLGFKISESRKFAFFIHAHIIPSFAIGSSGNFSGTGTYDANYFLPESQIPAEFRLLEEGAIDKDEYLNPDASFQPFNAFRVGENLPINVETEADMAFGFGVQVSPIAYFSFSDNDPTWGVLAGIDLNYHLGFGLNHNPINDLQDNVLKFQDEYGNGTSLLNTYLDDLGGFSYGIRLGLFHRLSTEP